MALEFKPLTYWEIIELSKNPSPEQELDKLSAGELHVLNERIDEIVDENSDNEGLFGKLMRLRTYAILAEEKRE